jgi:hypothetical protein
MADLKVNEVKIKVNPTFWLEPLPIVDGGTQLKWALVERGKTPEGADVCVHRFSVGIGVDLATTGAALVLFGKRLVGGILALAGAAVAAIGLEIIR